MGTSRTFRRAAPLLVTGALLFACGTGGWASAPKASRSGAARKPKGGANLEIERQVAALNPQKVSYTAVPLTAASAPAPRPKASPAAASTRHLGNPSLNGRLPGKL